MNIKKRLDLLRDSCNSYNKIHTLIAIVQDLASVIENQQKKIDDQQKQINDNRIPPPYPPPHDEEAFSRRGEW